MVFLLKNFTRKCTYNVLIARDGKGEILNVTINMVASEHPWISSW
jgi:hypothetical protein